MSIITNIMSIILVSSMLCTTYQQYMLTSVEIQSEKRVDIGEKLITKNLNYLKEDIKIPQLMGGNDEEKINLMNNMINSDILPKVNEAEKISKEYFDISIEEKPTFQYEIYSKYTVTNNSKDIISLYNDYYEFLGGAHGITIRTSYTIDKEKERFLSLKDLFISEYDYKDIINKEIKSKIDKEPDNYFDSGSGFKGIDDNQKFYIEGNNLVIYYQIYDIAPYVFGIPQFKIPLSLFDTNFIYHKNINSN